MEIGYFLSSEEYGPGDLVEQARRAEAAGWRELLISDHYHPWIDAQGHSPFVWGVIGTIAAARADHHGHHRGDLPDAAHPPGGARPGHGHRLAPARRPVPVRCRQRREPQRAHPR